MPEIFMTLRLIYDCSKLVLESCTVCRDAHTVTLSAEPHAHSSISYNLSPSVPLISSTSLFKFSCPVEIFPVLLTTMSLRLD